MQVYFVCFVPFVVTIFSSLRESTVANPFNWLNDELASLETRSLVRGRREVQSLAGGCCQIDGRKLWNFAGNDYLGFVRDPVVIAAAQDALNEGVGAGASALVTGRTHWHAELEQRLAEFKGTEAAILFPTGFAANFGTIVSLVGSEDIVFCDRLNHASLIDGARHSKARFRVYPHCNMNALRTELEKSAEFRRRLIVTDSLFSMDGDVAPLAELTSLAEQFNSMLLVDEAHATGIFGDRGTGLLEAQNVKSGNVVAVGTLSKAIGAQGGFVAGSQSFCDWLWNTARTSMFSTALAPPICAAAQASLKLIETEPHRREWLRSASLRVVEALRSQEWEIPDGVDGPIIPVLTGTPENTIKLSKQLQQQGLLVAAIRPPTVPQGKSRLRISLSHAHGEEGVEALIQAFEKFMSPI